MKQFLPHQSKYFVQNSLTNFFKYFTILRTNYNQILNSSQKLENPSANRNSPPILDVLRKIFVNKNVNQQLLEISSGTGQHSAYFANDFPNITFQPSEYDRTMMLSIQKYAEDSINKNVKNPIFIDISTDYQNWEIKFNEENFDFMLNINMIHISPIQCTQGLFRNAGKLLKINGYLITYGPYAVDGVLQPDSNVKFNEMLKSKNPEWGVRDLNDLILLAKQNDIELKEIINMPANNKTLVWQKK